MKEIKIKLRKNKEKKLKFDLFFDGKLLNEKRLAKLVKKSFEAPVEFKITSVSFCFKKGWSGHKKVNKFKIIEGKIYFIEKKTKDLIYIPRNTDQLKSFSMAVVCAAK